MKICSFTVKMTVFEKLVYRVRALWVLKLGFLASLGITRQGKIFKNHLQVLPLLFHISRPGAYIFCGTLYSCAPPTPAPAPAPVGYERKRRKKKMIQGRYAVRRNGDDDDDDDGGGGVPNRHEVAASLVSSSEARAAAAIRRGGEHKCRGHSLMHFLGACPLRTTLFLL